MTKEILCSAFHSYCSYFALKMKWKLFLATFQLAVFFTNACVNPDLNPLQHVGDIVTQVKNTSVILEYNTIDNESKLRTSLYISDPENTSPAQHEVKTCGTNKICIQAGNVQHTEIDKSNGLIKVSHTINDAEAKIIVCIELKDGVQWFGGPQMKYQRWPIQKMYFEGEPYVPTHPTNMAITERYWLSSEGNYIFVDDSVPLFLDQNNYKENHLCLIAKNGKPYPSQTSINLRYEIGTMIGNPRLAHELVIKNHLGKPTAIPDEKMIQYPIWSTWAKYKVNVNQFNVNQFAQEIVDNGFQNSQIEIDDNWETCYGSAEFDTNKFTDIATLITTLKSKGFRTTLWIHPFINEDCTTSYNEARDAGYFVKNTDDSITTAWWQGTRAAVIDFTNSAAVTWWVNRLKKLQEIGIDSFKFDAGEVSWLPQPPVLIGNNELGPGIFTQKYVTSLAENFNNMIEARVGWRTQNLPIFIRMIDKDSRWTMNNGLPTLITTLLQMNLNGYVFVLPDMIGGNGYVDNSFEQTELPSKELFIRWLQANVFMPSLQFSFVPWQYDSQTIAISKSMTELHERIAPRIKIAMETAVNTGAPVNPPIWWIDPKNKEAHKINDEFLLGEDILAAPVIEEGAVSRDIYLPYGTWRDGNTQNVHFGPKWIRNYPAPLNVLPHFYKF
ncbi:myogenesis-regulating glycosidase [Leptopilina heterotoma]|uniref:myogenesis-regulating glycosidase n=1 Tax=Leptopilina heterotoma TaxID=63436 RepID=UPI001CA81CC0|nr:myogenesis-regulating glycosidase [Leptopilina heterotoma]